MHLLPTPTASLDETATAIDLAQSPAEVVALSFSDSDLTALGAAWARDAHRLPSLRLASLKRLRHPMSVDLYADRTLSKSRLVVVRCLGGLDYWRYGFERLERLAQERGLLVAALPGDDRSDERLAALSTVPTEALAHLDRCFRAGGIDNLGIALRIAHNLIGGDHAIDEPRALDACVAMTADGVPADLHTAMSTDDPRPAALIVGYRASLLAADTRPLIALMHEIDARGLAPVGLAVSSLKDPTAIPGVERVIAARRPAVILNATAFSALRDDDTSVLDAAGVPVLQVALAGTSREAWEASPRGLSTADLAMNVVLPELDGRLFTRAISFKADAEIDARLEHAALIHEPAHDRIAHVADLAIAWSRLNAKQPRERRVALVLSDYPARGGRTGYAVGLDTPASVLEIARWLAEAGYDLGSDAPTAGDVANLLDGSGAQISISLDDYRGWLTTLPPALQDALTEAWGTPEHDPALDGGTFRFPALIAGNLIVLVQPDRGSRADRRTGYHDVTTPPRHAYVALYLALGRRERIDAMIHLGTHGTLEWLPGKAAALSATCWPEVLLGPVPVIYPFIVNNPGEAIPAKRRLGAVTIGHMTPPLFAAGLDTALAQIEALVEEYAAAETADPRRAKLIEREILAEAARSGLAAECGIAGTLAPRDAIARLDARLCDIKELAIRDGLHVLGRRQPPERETALCQAIAASASPEEREAMAHLAADRVATCARAERTALLAALDGRRIPPGPAGAPTRGRLDVLPTGRNMTTLDPRALPTRTAAAIGARAAEEVVRRHLQEHGDYPRNVLVDLWASATLRTGGDDLAGVLALIGARPQWDPASNRVTGVEAIPLPKLDRPRIDVTLRMSGLFRDLFETQIALIAGAIRLVAGLDEPDEWNPLAAARRRGESQLRVFGSAPGGYGTGTADLALDGDWRDRAALGRAYLDATTHAYDRDVAGVPAADAFRIRVATAEAIVHAQDDRERDVLDGDGVADFVGGFAAAAELLGASPALYHLDTSRPEAPTVRTFDHEIARIVRGRLANPRWLDGMLRHGSAGVAEIAQGIDAMFAFAATTRAVHGHLFDLVHARLVADRARHDAMRAANPAATAAIVERLADALARGLWVPRRNAVHRELAAHTSRTAEVVP